MSEMTTEDSFQTAGLQAHRQQAMAGLVGRGVKRSLSARESVLARTPHQTKQKVQFGNSKL